MITYIESAAEVDEAEVVPTAIACEPPIAEARLPEADDDDERFSILDPKTALHAFGEEAGIVFGRGKRLEQRRGIERTACDLSIDLVHRDGQAGDAPVGLECRLPDVWGEPFVRHGSQYCRIVRVRCRYW